MNRYVITEGRVFRTPVYVAESEAGATAWLDQKEAEHKADNKATTRQNSLTLSAKSKAENCYIGFDYEVFSVLTWEQDSATNQSVGKPEDGSS